MHASVVKCQADDAAALCAFLHPRAVTTGHKHLMRRCRYGDWRQLRPLAMPLCSGKRILMLGCGNSSLSADMYDPSLLLLEPYLPCE